MQQQVVCAGCQKAYWPTQSWIHEKCNQPVTTLIAQREPIRSGPTVTVTICRDCVTKDEEIARLRNQLAEAVRKAVVIEKLKPKRARAEYMREFRKKHAQTQH